MTRRATKHSYLISLVLAATGSLGSGVAHASSWICSGTDFWSNSSCWFTGVLPVAGDTVLLTQGGASDRTVNYDNSFNPAANFNSVRIDAAGAGQMTLNQDQNYSLNASSLYVGRDGSGTMLQSNGMNTFGTGYIGANTGSTGSYSLSGLGMANWNFLYVGNSGNGNFHQSGGSNTVSNQLVIGGENGGSGTYALDGGSLTVNSDSIIGRWGNGQFLHNAGTHTVNGSMYVGRKAGEIGSPVSGSYILNTGSVSANRLEVGVIPPINTHPTLEDVYPNIHEASDGEFVQNGGSVTINGDVIVSTSGGAIGKYKLNDGTLTAQRVVNNDSFRYAGGSLIADVENHDVFAVAGTGLHTINGNFTNVGTSHYTQLTYAETKHGRIDMLDGARMEVTQNLILEADGSLAVELGPAFYAITDWITVGGDASVGGILDLQSILPGFDPVTGDSWTLLAATNVSGTFQNVLFPAVPNWNWVIDYTGSEVILTGTAVPVPAAVWLFGSGLLGLVGIGRRGRRQ